MRSLVSDDKYFEFLNGINDDILAHIELAAVCLIAEFPHLRAEEAKAVWKDWHMSKRAPWRNQPVKAGSPVAPIASGPLEPPICEGHVTDVEKLATLRI